MSMWEFRKNASATLVGLLGLLGVLVGTSSAHARDSAPAAPGECEIHEDEQGIFHARAKTDLQATACLGYLHGRYRSWQMDFLRKIFQGKRAEILGKNYISGDFGMRLFGFERKAKEILLQLPEADQVLLREYARGVSHGFQVAIDQELPYEFKKLGYRPAAWTPVDTLALLILQSFDQTRKAYENDLSEAKWMARYGDHVERWFTEDHVPWNTAILKAGEYPTQTHSKKKKKTSSSSDVVRSAFQKFSQWLPKESLPGMGSNSWVLSPARSETGHAWFANDPHLDLKHPPFWQWIHVQGATLDVIGATLPGSPLHVSGTNRDVAWGLTNAYMDMADIAFVPEGDVEDGEKEWPTIWVKLWKVKLPFFFKSLRRTREGWPVLPIDAPKGYVAVLRWTGYDLKPSDFSALLRLNYSKSAEQVSQVFAQARIPSWNFVFADTQGKIGLRVNGIVPKRSSPPEFGVPTLRLADLRSWEFLSPQEMPHLMNPARGFIATANNRHWNLDSAFAEGRAHYAGFRAFRIEELLEAKPKHDLASNRKIQCDIQAVDARFLLAPLVKAWEQETDTLEKEPGEKEAIALLKSWDLEAGLECRACALYRYWVSHLQMELGMNESALFHALEPSADLPEKLSVRGSLLLAVKEFYVPATAGFKPWKEIHLNFFRHLSGSKKFRRDDMSIPTQGDEHTVNPGSMTWTGKLFEQDGGASQRLIVELSSPPKVYVQLAGSNRDLENPKLTDPSGPWMKWARCEQTKVAYPFDFSGVKSEKIKIPRALAKPELLAPETETP